MNNSVTQLDSHTYQIPEYKVVESGTEVIGTKNILFCRGSRIEGQAVSQDGVFDRHLLEVCKMYLSSVNKGDLQNRYTDDAINFIELALGALNKRRNERTERGVIATYNK